MIEALIGVFLVFSLGQSDAKAIVINELLVDKLKLLKYDHIFCQTRTPPWERLHRFYFAVSSPNRNDQFMYFASLVAWLYSLIGVPFPAPSDNDDLNPICSNIVLQLREVGFAPPSWSPSKLKQGHGDAVCSVLDSLVDLVLEIKNFQFAVPMYTDLGKAIVVDEIGSEAADELCVSKPSKPNEAASSVFPDLLTESTSTSKIDPNHWKMDLERLAPQLSLPLVPDGKEWRTHLEQAQQLHAGISKQLVSNNAELERVEGNISSTLEKLQSREKFINSQIEPLTTEYSAVKRRLSEAQQKYGNSLDNVTELTNEIAHISEQIEQVKFHVLELSTFSK
ncbi:intraflagellar transport protein 57 [Selaginella moellendorffii]|uniref:Intraflagellar transport protein 57 n=1 Tax=Selaginella moellendorffii TaxID=88036 RepID=D8RPQ2_SELML|nr:intraflagellar transport protein 57 [Selaginella moellendorffii]